MLVLVGAELGCITVKDWLSNSGIAHQCCGANPRPNNAYPFADIRTEAVGVSGFNGLIPSNNLLCKILTSIIDINTNRRIWRCCWCWSSALLSTTKLPVRRYCHPDINRSLDNTRRHRSLGKLEDYLYGINKGLPQSALGIGGVFESFKKVTEWSLRECLRNELLHISKSIERVSLEILTEQSLGLKPFCHSLGGVCSRGSRNTFFSKVLLGNAKLIDGGDVERE